MSFILFAFYSGTDTVNLMGQMRDRAGAELLDHRDTSAPLRTFAPVGPVAIHGRTAFICWPRELIGQATITAVDLDTWQLKWKRVIGPHNASACRPFGSHLFYRTSPDMRLQESNGHEGSEECLLSLETGKGVSSSVGGPIGRIAFSDSYLVANRVYRVNSTEGMTVDPFFRTSAVIDGDKSFEMGFHLDEHDRLTGDSVLRRIDLKTGTVDFTDESAATLGVLVGTRENRVVLQTEIPLHEIGQFPQYGLIPMKTELACYDLERQTVLWKIDIPCRVRAARFRDDGRLDCQCDGTAGPHETLVANAPERIPLLVDIEMGTFEIDPVWRDPNSLSAWHAGAKAIVHAMRNDRYQIAMLGNQELLCVDSKSGRLVWRQSSGAWVHFSEKLGDKVITSIPGGVEVIDVKTGASRAIEPASLGL